MKQLLFLLLPAVLCTTACRDKSHTCICKDPERGNEQVDRFDISDEFEESAAARCINRGIDYNKLPDYNYVSCELE